jgi:serine protease Do
VVRFKTFLLAGALVFTGTVLGLSWQLWAQIAGALATDQLDDRQQAYAQLDRDVRALERTGQVLSLVKRTAQLAASFVVHIEAQKSDSGTRSSRGRPVEEAGAGILFERQKAFYVITNRHVIKDAPTDRIAIHLDDGRALTPRRVLTDPDTDVAVLPLPAGDFTSARLGDSRQVAVGDFVLAVGSPFGLSRSISLGIISAKGRRDLKLGGDALKFQDFFQTDAAINPGNSGGPLLNLRGEVIALNTAIASASGINEGIGFGIPINMVMFVARQLIDSGVVRRARLGVSLDREFKYDMARDLGLSRLQGTRLTQVEPGSPAEAAGLQVGDVILEFDGIPLDSDVHLVNLVSMTAVGQSVPLLVLRNRRTMQITCKLSERPSMSRAAERPMEDEDVRLALHDAESWSVKALGVELVELTPEMQQRLKLSRNVTGALVARVDPAGPLAEQVQRGEIIDRIEQQTVRNVQDIHRVLSEQAADQGVRLHVIPTQPNSAPARTVLVQPGVAYR